MRTRRLPLPRLSAFAVAGALLLAALVPLPAQAAPNAYYASAAIAVGNRATDVAFNATTNMIYVANTGDNTVSAINATTGVVTSTFPAGLMTNPGQPSNLAVNERTNTLYVTNSNHDPAHPTYNTVSKIDLATGVLTPIRAGLYPYAMVVNETTNKIYVANLSHSVSEIDGATDVVTTFDVGISTSQPTAIAVNETTNTIYAVDYIGSKLFEIDGLTRAVKPGITVATNPFGVAVNETTNTVYATGLGNNALTVFNGTTRAITTTIPLGSQPFELQVDEGRNTVFVARAANNFVAVIDGATNTVASAVNVGANTRAIALNTATNTVYATRDDNKLSVISPMVAPVINTTSLAGGTVGTAYSATVATTGTAPITFAVTTGALPAGLTLSTATGAITGTPTAAGSANFTITATNAAGNNAQSFTITTSQAPTITTTTLPNPTVGAAYAQIVAATGTDPITFTVAGILPAGLTLNTTSGVISGTPTAAGSVTFTITATNVAGSDSQEFTLNPIVAAPYISTLTLPAGQVGQAYSATITTMGSGPITFSISSGNLPAGLTLNPGTGEIMGTPSSGGQATFTVKATNMALSNEKTLTITITEAPAITTESLAGATVGTAYSATVEATGTAPIAFTVSAGELPAGLSLDAATGEITGTPTTAGSATFTITASNVEGSNAKEFTLTTSLTPTITTTSLGAATVGTAYSATVEATGTGPIAFTVSAGELPAGLSLDAATGEITGTPTTAGSATFTITGTNVAGSNAKEFTLTTSLAPAATTKPTPVATTSPTPVVTTKASPAAPLAKTGIDALPWLAGSGIVLLAGAMLVLLTTSRRRRTA